MDLDAFIARHSAEWQRLDALVHQRRLTGAEADELIVLYRRAATHLSLVQSRTPDPALAARLSALLGRARGAAVGGNRNTGWAAFAHGVTVDFPVAVYLARRWWGAVALVSVVVMGAMMLWIRSHPDPLAKLVPPDEIRQLVDHDFENYYSEHPAQSFAAQVWVNNALVAAFALLLGVTLVGTLWIMWSNVTNIGITAGVMLAAGKADVFFGLILPHGLLELTAVFVAAGAGLRMGWAWVDPGPLPRGQALAAAGRSASVIAVGLVFVLLVSGVIEAFVTPSPLPTWARIAIGITAEVAFLAYVFVLGRRAALAGETGDLQFGEREDVVPVA